MAIEDEIKFVLHLGGGALRNSLEHLGHSIIEQAYLDAGARIRNSRFARPVPRHQEFTFTWKKRLPAGSNIEIETAITAEDYRILWPMASSSLVKHRFRLPELQGEGVIWDIDFFLDDGRPVLALAEAESRTGKLPVDFAVHPLVADHVVERVARDERNFDSWALSNRDHLLAMSRRVEEAMTLSVQHAF